MGTDPPPSVMASWPAPNTINPHSQGNGLLAMQLALVVIVVLVVSLRICIALFLNQKFKTGDWMLIPATIFYIGLTVASSLGIKRYGWGKHAWDVSLSKRETALLVSFVCELLITWSLSLTKLSLCYFYLQQIPSLDKQSSWRRRWTVYLLIGLTLAWAVESTFTTIFQCLPVKGMWKINYPGEHCNGQRPGMIVHVVVDIVTVVGIYLWPFSVLLRAVILSWKQKAMAAGLIAIGAFVCAASILRLPATLRSTSDYDITWFMCNTYRWSILECSLAIILATLPLLTSLLPNSFISEATAKTLRSPSTKSKAFQNQGVHSYPLAHIQTTATTNAANSGGWWGTTKSQERNLNESEENIISKEVIEAPSGSAKGRLDRRIDIHKTTVIEQRFEADLEKGGDTHKSRT